jgi:hypothetical protein
MPRSKGEAVTVVDPIPTSVPAMRIRMEYSAGNGVAFAAEFFPDATVGQDELDERLDTIGAALDRQKAKFEIPQIEHQIAACEHQIAQHGRLLVAEEEKLVERAADRRGGIASLPPQTKMSRDQTRAALDQLKDNLVKFRADLEERRRIVRGPPLRAAAE